uniref:Uncharacterized protein n=1 Tax=Setaria viridis TaxID=4556 RepID=A0A4U6VAT0_SETVI|nr:hypothetical protein SEVIR_3G079950v2 [Setaria viridis]
MCTSISISDLNRNHSGKRRVELSQFILDFH